MVIANTYSNFVLNKSRATKIFHLLCGSRWDYWSNLCKLWLLLTTTGKFRHIWATFARPCPHVCTFGLFDWQCSLVFSLHILPLFSFPPFFKYRGYCNYGGGDNYKMALIPRRSPTRRRANRARKWISPWCRKSYHVSLSNETNIQRKPKDENMSKLQ